MPNQQTSYADKMKGSSKSSSRRNSMTSEQPLISTQRRLSSDTSSHISTSDKIDTSARRRRSSIDLSHGLADHKVDIDSNKYYSRHDIEKAKSKSMGRSFSLTNLSQNGSTLDLHATAKKSSDDMEEKMKSLGLKNKSSGLIKRHGSHGSLYNKDLCRTSFSSDNNYYGKGECSSSGKLFNKSLNPRQHGSTESINNKDLKETLKQDLNREKKRKLSQERCHQKKTSASNEELKHDKGTKRPKNIGCLPSFGNTWNKVNMFSKKDKGPKRMPVNNSSTRNNPTKASYIPKAPYATNF